MASNQRSFCARRTATCHEPYAIPPAHYSLRVDVASTAHRPLVSGLGAFGCMDYCGAVLSWGACTRDGSVLCPSGASAAGLRLGGVPHHPAQPSLAYRHQHGPTAFAGGTPAPSRRFLGLFWQFAPRFSLLICS